MTELEENVMQALGQVRMKIASNGKRFFRDMESSLRVDPNFQLTVNQAKFLWSLVHLYRRQITSARIRDIADRLHMGEEIPEVFELAEHRVKTAREVVRPKKRTRYDDEIEKGGGKLKL
jgi:hypothetical protein